MTTCSDSTIHQTFSNGERPVHISSHTLIFSRQTLAQIWAGLPCSFTSPVLSGLCVRLAGYRSGTVEWECLRIRSWLASSAPFPLTYASTTREPSCLITRARRSAPTHCPPSFLCAAPEWRGWWKSTSCVCTRSCDRSASLRCSSERSHGGWT